MYRKSFQQFLSLLALLGTVHATNSPIAQCTAQAWVRAPDLTPDTVIQGDARVKISAECPTVDSVMLGLRLKERLFVKALRSQEDRDWMSSVASPSIHRPRASWIPLNSRSSNPRDEITFREMLINKDLWVVREMERVAFETTQTVHLEDGTSGDRDVVQEFGVLVPPTNFPPGLDYLGSEVHFMNHAGDFEMVNVESMYEYFVRIPFANGTTREISAGFTAFQPLHDPADAPRGPNSRTAVLKSQHPCIAIDQKYAPLTNYTVQITGLVFTQGSEDQAVTVVVTRTGPARTFTKPLTIDGYIRSTFSSKWAAKYKIPNSQINRRPQYILRATLEDYQGADLARRPHFDDHTFSVIMPNSTADEIKSQTIVTTMSAPVTLPIKVNRRHISDFDMFYQTLSNSLWITLRTPRAPNDTVDPDEPFSQGGRFPFRGRTFADDEEPWVPWEKTVEMPQWATWDTYSGNVPVIVHPMGEVAPSCHAQSGKDMSSQAVVLLGETGCQPRAINHYLDEGARGPTFVESGAVHECLAEGSAARARRAMIPRPVISALSNGEALLPRHYHSNPHLIYVGETWVKKVVNKASSSLH